MLKTCITLIELHIHLDGSLEPDEIITLADLTGTQLPTRDIKALGDLITVPVDCKDLAEYLKCFDLPLTVLQTAEAVKQAVKMLVLRLAKQGIIYAEIRFAPQLHTKNGASQIEIAASAAEGLFEAQKICGMRSQLILCCMRGAEQDVNLKTVYAAKELLHKGVCAVDLAGNEAAFATSRYCKLFEIASQLGVPFTIHAGEAAGPQSIRQAIDLGAKRVGHGIRAYLDRDLIKTIKNDGIVLENCYTSNIQTRAVDQTHCYPFAFYIKNGINATVCTDNSTVSGSTLKNEYLKLAADFDLDTDMLQTAALNAAKGAFVDEDTRQKLMLDVKNEFANWLSD